MVKNEITYIIYDSTDIIIYFFLFFLLKDFSSLFGSFNSVSEENFVLVIVIEASVNYSLGLLKFFIIFFLFPIEIHRTKIYFIHCQFCCVSKYAISICSILYLDLIYFYESLFHSLFYFFFLIILF